MIQSLIKAFDGDFLEFSPEQNFDKNRTLAFLKKQKKINDQVLIIDYGFEFQKENEKYLLVSDHINLSGQNRLMGTNDNALGERFFPLNNLYITNQSSQPIEEIAKGILIGFQLGFKPNTSQKDFFVNLLPETKAYAYNLIFASLMAAHQKIKVCGLIKFIS